MAFEGDLTNLGLADIFQTLNMNRQSGTLVVKNGDAERRFHFTDEGVSLLTSRSARRFRLGNLLVGMGRLTEGDLRVAVLKQERAKDAKIGDILVQTDMVKPEDISEACRYQAAEEIYDSFNWRSGKFQFLEGANAGPSGGPGPFAEFFFEVMDVVMEAARRTDEFAITMGKVGDVNEFFIRSGSDPAPEAEVGRPATMLHESLDGTMDVQQVFDEFYLSPFDTAQAFVALLDRNLVRPMSADDLRAAAEPFLLKKDYARAARMLARAIHHRPGDVSLLSAHAEALVAGGSRKEAAAALVELGTAHRAEGQPVEAIEALRKAVEQDARNERAFELLMEVHTGLEQLDRAEESCREAARLLADDRNFEAALRILDRGLESQPGSLQMRVQRANCLLAMGRREDGIQELNAVSAELENKRDRGSLLLTVYRKLLQMEPDRKDLRARIDEILAGEKARAARQKYVKVGAFSGLFLVVILVWLFKPASSMDQLAAIQKSLSDPSKLQDAAIQVRAIRDAAAPDSDEASTASDILRIIEDRLAAPDREARLAAFKKKVDEECFLPAEKAMEAGRYAEAIQLALDGLDRARKGADAPVKAATGFKQFLEGCIDQVRKEIKAADSGLRAAYKEVQSTLTSLEAVRVERADKEKKRWVYTTAGAVLDKRSAVDWPATLKMIQTAHEQSVSVEADGIRIIDLQGLIDEMGVNYAALDRKWNHARAEVDAEDLKDAYTATLEGIRESKSSGDLDKGISIADEFLARCARFREGKPEEFYTPLISILLEGALARDKEVAGLRASLETTRRRIQAGRTALEAGKLQEAFDRFREAIIGDPTVDFTGRVMLPLRIETRPAGARVFVTLPGEQPFDKGLADPSSDLMYPYQGETVIRLELAGFETAVLKRKGVVEDRAAIVQVELQRTVRWQRDVGGSVEGVAGIEGDALVVGNRSGLVSILGLRDGTERHQFATNHASGIRGGVLVNGGVAYFGGYDKEAFALNVATGKLVWRTPLPGACSRRPCILGSTVVFSDEEGNLVALQRGDGKPAWTLDVDSPVTGGPVAIDGSIVAGLANGDLLAADGAGKLKWRTPLSGPVYGIPASDGRGNVVVGTEDATLECRRLSDGGEVFPAVKCEAAVHAPAHVQSGVITVLTVRGHLTRIDARTGKISGTQELGHQTDGGTAVRGDTLYATSTGGRVVAVDLRDGRILWVLSGLAPLQAPPVLGDDSLILVGANDDGLVMALEP